MTSQEVIDALVANGWTLDRIRIVSEEAATFIKILQNLDM